MRIFSSNSTASDKNVANIETFIQDNFGNFSSMKARKKPHYISKTTNINAMFYKTKFYITALLNRII